MATAVTETTTNQVPDQMLNLKIAVENNRHFQGSLLGTTGVALAGLSFLPFDPISRLIISTTGMLSALIGYSLRKTAGEQLGLIANSINSASFHKQ